MEIIDVKINPIIFRNYGEIILTNKTDGELFNLEISVLDAKGVVVNIFKKTNEIELSKIYGSTKGLYTKSFGNTFPYKIDLKWNNKYGKKYIEQFEVKE